MNVLTIYDDEHYFKQKEKNRLIEFLSVIRHFWADFPQPEKCPITDKTKVFKTRS
jgi:hypothetical protein